MMIMGTRKYRWLGMIDLIPHSVLQKYRACISALAWRLAKTEETNIASSAARDKFANTMVNAHPPAVHDPVFSCQLAASQVFQ